MFNYEEEKEDNINLEDFMLDNVSKINLSSDFSKKIVMSDNTGKSISLDRFISNRNKSLKSGEYLNLNEVILVLNSFLLKEASCITAECDKYVNLYEIKIIGCREKRKKITIEDFLKQVKEIVNNGVNKIKLSGRIAFNRDVDLVSFSYSGGEEMGYPHNGLFPLKDMNFKIASGEYVLKDDIMKFLYKYFLVDDLDIVVVNRKRRKLFF